LFISVNASDNVFQAAESTCLVIAFHDHVVKLTVISCQVGVTGAFGVGVTGSGYF
jgi:hypothetical protein